MYGRFSLSRSKGQRRRHRRAGFGGGAALGPRPSMRLSGGERGVDGPGRRRPGGAARAASSSDGFFPDGSVCGVSSFEGYT